METNAETTTKRERKTKYYVTTQSKEFETKREAEKWLNENRPTQDTKIIKGAVANHRVIENIVLS